MIKWLMNNKEWLFDGIGIAIISGIISLIIKICIKKASLKNKGRNETTKIINKASDRGILIGDRAVIQGSIVNGDITINLDPIRERIDELIEILNERAEIIKKELAPHYKYVIVQDYIKSFSFLHEQHIAALKKGNLVHAHKLLTQIHKLSFTLEKNEFWNRHNIETPGFKYQLGGEFERGEILFLYLKGNFKNEFSGYPSDPAFYCYNRPKLKDSLLIYQKILMSKENL